MKLYTSQEPVENAATHEKSRRSGFVENWQGALGLAIAEDLPVTSRMVSTTTESRRKKQIVDYLASGEIPQSVAHFYGSDFNGLAAYSKDVLGLEGFVTDEDYEEARQAEYKVMRDYSASVSEKQSTMGFIGEMAGSAHAMALDPIYATSFLTGYGSAATIGQAALRVGAMEAGIEAVAAGPKMSWREEINADSSAARALTEIAFAGIGAGAIAGLGKGLSKVLTPKDLTVGQVTEVIEEMAKRNPEMVPIINTLKHADPEENLSKVLEADEAIDIRRASEGPPKTDEKARAPLKAEEYAKVEEEMYLKRQPIEPEGEGVPRGTPEEQPAPEPDLRHPMVKEADDLVAKRDRIIEVMEDCF